MGKDEQHSCIVDAQRRYMYDYTSQHTLWECTTPFMAVEPAEFGCLLDSVSPLVKVKPKDVGNKRRQS